MPYPAAPGKRMPYDRDGTAGFYQDEPVGPLVILTNGQMVAWNNETTDQMVDFGNNGYWAGLVFPELRDIEGFHTNLNYTPSSMQTSGDTTNGIDGTWTTRLASFSSSNTGVNGYYRSNMVGMAVANVKGIRFYSAFQNYSFHVYGKASAGQNPDRFIFWHPTLDQELAPNALDPGTSGDVMRGQTYNMDFRIKNNSATKTATNLTLSTEALTDNSPSVVAMCTLSYNGGPFSANVTIPSLGPGVISQVTTLRLAVSLTASINVCTPRINAVPQTYA